MNHGLILDGPHKGGYKECSAATLYLSSTLELVPLGYCPAPLRPVNDVIEYQKVWLEKCTVYAWILK